MSPWLCIALAVASLAYQALIHVGEWRTTAAYEQEWVADALASGHGFSFDAGSAWLGPYEDASEYSSTAWVVPVQPLLIAGSYRIFGSHAHLVMLVLNFVWTGAACFIAYRLGRRLHGSAAGAAAALGVAFLPTLVSPASWLLGRYIGNAALAGLLFLLCGLLLVRCIERPSLRRAFELGALIGLTALTHGGSLIFLPVTAVVIAWTARSQTGASWKAVGVMILTCCVVVAPWAVRNTLRFGTFVPLRTGGGFQLHVGNPALAGTLGIEIGNEGQRIVPPWTSDGVWEALERLQTTEGNRALRSYSHSLVLASAPSGYAGFNEAQRDALYTKATREFIFAEPWVTLKMAVAKAVLFFFTGWDLKLGAITVLALLGLAATIRDRRSVAVFLLVLAYAVPYALSAPMYYRYRGPVDSLLIVFVGLAVGTAVQWLSEAGRRSVRTPRA